MPLEEFTAGLALVDHHVHGAFAETLTRQEFEEALNEGSPGPVPPGTTQLDSQVGFAVRARCAPLLDLPAHASADAYWARRAELGDLAVAARLLPAAGVDHWLVDTEHQGERLLSPAELARTGGGAAHRIVRLEALAETLAAAGTSAASYADDYRDLLRAACRDAVGVKTIAAYRTGLDLDWSRPRDADVREAARRWLAAAGPAPRLADPVLVRFGVHCAVGLGLPLQIHTGLGDRDLDLRRADPLLLLGLLRRPDVMAVPVMLLHCYPYHRGAGWLAQAFENVYCDVGLAVNQVGARAPAVVAESLELAPFAKLLYSSDAFGPPELHFLGAALWRRAAAAAARAWVAAGDWSEPDARRVIAMVGRENALRAYRL
ncbi:amidohydrolase family protein [Streptomyces sp. HPF1205]|uniref:amidohydrolase family protein n=1 Tax=Streptomyces sp. HPF1205 TaxID=2873262 RepID=UPI001CEC816A|nr:amidohydrolase family protein [Streptomyces sp. HPF1205]